MNVFSFLVGAFVGCLLGVLVLGLTRAAEGSSPEPASQPTTQSEPTAQPHAIRSPHRHV